ncbi:cell division protein FtsQ/DivIB [Calothrix sp. 336/3]|uniref:cell division protein FtsQ/DivIB n=1 Tax=Calothrix sp. 336/3 TaxID=1337936 RepID=UPI0004E30F70|nr:FtsQ-type POTRA domain-containing protein [Calothrix sp. 336/3]AKG23671.1 cell division protein FtsQ [Calothrix sp. 336/3]
MAGIISVSRTDLAQRRKRLRRQRQMRILQMFWRSFAVTTLAIALLWVTIQPIWILRTPSDIVVSGNQFMSSETIQSLTVVSYPQSLWRIEPAKIAQTLQKQPIIVQAQVTRRLFPPGLLVQVQERIPVAMVSKEPPTAIAERTTGVKIRGKSTNSNRNKTSVGLLDAKGVWMPLDKMTADKLSAKLPSLKVIGLPEQYRLYWALLYQSISQSSLKVNEINWQDSNNLILKTELGSVHLGTPSSQIPEQIKTLTQMRYLHSQLDSQQIDYIDLRKPNFPLVQMNQKVKDIPPEKP